VAPRLMRLIVRADTTADFSIEFIGVGTTHHPGHWTADGDRLTMQPELASGTPSEFPFRWRLEGARLVPLAWDKNVYGGERVELTRVVLPALPTDSSAGAKR
jgi:hypothetical protein